MSARALSVEMIDAASNDATAEPTGTAVSTIAQAALRELSAVEAGIAELTTKYAGTVYPVKTTKGMAEAVAARMAIREPRFKLTPIVKEMKHQLRLASGQLDSEAERIKGLLMALETPIDEQIKAEEKRKEDARAETQRLKAEADAKAKELVDAIRNRVTMAVGQKPDALREMRGVLDAIDLAEHDLGARAGEALRAKAETLAKLDEMIAAAVAWEETQVRERERQRVAAIRSAIDQFGRVALEAIGMPGSAIAEARAGLASAEITEERFAEFVAEAIIARDKAVQQLTALYNAAQDAALASVAVARVEVAAAQLDTQREQQTQAQAEIERVQSEQAVKATAIQTARTAQIAAALQLIEDSRRLYNADMPSATLATAIEERRTAPLSVSIYGGKIGPAKAATVAALVALESMHAKAVERETLAAQAKEVEPAAAPAPAPEPAPTSHALLDRHVPGFGPTTTQALRDLLRLIDETQGVAGYLDHKGITLWEDIPEVVAAQRALADFDAPAPF